MIWQSLARANQGTIPVMDSLKNLKVIRIAMLASVVFYGVIATLVPSNAEPNPVVFYAFAAIAIMEVVGIFGLRRTVFPQTATLSPPDEKVSVKPETALIIIYCLSEAVALYGLVLHFFGFSFVQVAPFFFAGLVLLFFFEPRRVVGSAIL